MSKIRQKIDSIFKSHMRFDGAEHLVSGIIIIDILKYIFPIHIAILYTLVILAGKEIIYDKLCKKGTAEWRDMLYGIIGLILGVV